MSCKEILLDLCNTVLQSYGKKETTLQETSECNSLTDTQRYQRCHCKIKHKTNKCTHRVVGNYEIQSRIVHYRLEINNYIKKNLKCLVKWLPLYCILGVVWLSIIYRSTKFESNDTYNSCIRKTIQNGDDLSA